MAELITGDGAAGEVRGVGILLILRDDDPATIRLSIVFGSSDDRELATRAIEIVGRDRGVVYDWQSGLKN